MGSGERFHVIYQSSLVSFLIGCIFSSSVTCLLLFPKSFSFSWLLWIASLCLFHLFEFILTAKTQPNLVTMDSFLLNHSREYHLALAAAAIEYWIERFCCPFLKESSFLLGIGITMVVGGQAIRSIAMYTAGSNFTHQVADEHTAGHSLVKNGIYTYLRHPAYFGWFWWSLGTQILLCNPICFVLYSFASWNFFANRIPYEEEMLVHFFADDYIRYKKRTIIGIPFIE